MLLGFTVEHLLEVRKFFQRAHIMDGDVPSLDELRPRLDFLLRRVQRKPDDMIARLDQWQRERRYLAPKSGDYW
jgi:hypothetical protein